ncbi:MAG: polysaccharide deacetylase family protein [Nannocystaceae bacterium]
MSTLVSVDLDDLVCHHAVLGLDAPTEDLAGVCLERILPRFEALFDETSCRATFFVIGRDLERDMAGAGRGAGRLQKLARGGHRLANHSYAHDYAMTDWRSELIAEDIARCDAVLRELGVQARGFRAPGYTHDRRLLMQVAAQGYDYDSSSLPSPTYYAAKLGAMALFRMRGRSSASRADNLRSFVGRRTPQFLADAGIWEVPISVSRSLRLPLIGTSLLSGPELVRRVLFAEAASMSHLHIELHAMDLADPAADGLEHLVGVQPGLKVPYEVRAARLRELLKARGGGVPIESVLE